MAHGAHGAHGTERPFRISEECQSKQHTPPVRPPMMKEAMINETRFISTLMELFLDVATFSIDLLSGLWAEGKA